MVVLTLAGVLLLGYRNTEFLDGRALVTRSEEARTVTTMRFLLESQKDLNELDAVLAQGTPSEGLALLGRYREIRDRASSWAPPESMRPGVDAVREHAAAGVALVEAIEQAYERGLPIPDSIDQQLIVAIDVTRSEENRIITTYTERYGLEQLAREYQT